MAAKLKRYARVSCLCLLCVAGTIFAAEPDPEPITVFGLQFGTSMRSVLETYRDQFKRSGTPRMRLREVQYENELMFPDGFPDERGIEVLPYSKVSWRPYRLANFDEGGRLWRVQFFLGGRLLPDAWNQYVSLTERLGGKYELTEQIRLPDPPPLQGLPRINKWPKACLAKIWEYTECAPTGTPRDPTHPYSPLSADGISKLWALYCSEAEPKTYKSTYRRGNAHYELTLRVVGYNGFADGVGCAPLAAIQFVVEYPTNGETLEEIRSRMLKKSKDAF